MLQIADLMVLSEGERETGKPQKLKLRRLRPTGIKRGRPPGAKSRPKWMLDALKKAPKPPMGRPKKGMERPKTLDELLLKIAEPKPPKPPRPTKPKKPRKRSRRKSAEPYFSKLKREDPEKLSRINQCKKVPGKPLGMNQVEWATCLDEARKIAKRILKDMDAKDALPENPLARKAMEEAIVMLASDLPAKDKLNVIRTVLEYNMAKPAATSNVNVRSAEDFLDDLAATD